MADGDEECRSSALTVWPSIVLLMCSWHQKKARETHEGYQRRLQAPGTEVRSGDRGWQGVDDNPAQVLPVFQRRVDNMYSEESMVSVRIPPRADNEQLLGENEQNFQGNNVFLWLYIIMFSPLFTFLAQRRTFFGPKRYVFGPNSNDTGPKLLLTYYL